MRMRQPDTLLTMKGYWSPACPALIKRLLAYKICRNPDWLRITVGYTVDTFFARRESSALAQVDTPCCGQIPATLPPCRKICWELKEATEIITPVLEERQQRPRSSQEAKPATKTRKDSNVIMSLPV
ncbi:putative cytochrome P450 monooxygenase [Aspergillus fumigatus Af293]|uniref:Cytochrome P450 monooxygenase, putative n=1 Tax=Aspergillus fumigatus (strain ATCC MYA-4609 / CBS 101355 / FGSC A1100 / Af293) TaxID=330879 RepID=Q4WP68_ASPFU|nr:cytochrome P450 monooxygenase, putative [Aspergillus fumigatus Af293]EAL89966.1 cytochrome P450 monooxygenase, putative [Aspergillus fumigatus Af293]